jgi:hypothetical protein
MYYVCLSTPATKRQHCALTIKITLSEAARGTVLVKTDWRRSAMCASLRLLDAAQIFVD